MKFSNNANQQRTGSGMQEFYPCTELFKQQTWRILTFRLLCYNIGWKFYELWKQCQFKIMTKAQTTLRKYGNNSNVRTTIFLSNLKLAHFACSVKIGQCSIVYILSLSFYLMVDVCLNKSFNIMLTINVLQLFIKPWIQKKITHSWTLVVDISCFFQVSVA